MTENPPCPTCDGKGVIFDLICDNCGGSASLPLGRTCSNHLAKPLTCPELHCVNGLVSDDWSRAIARAVMTGFDPCWDAEDIIDYLRAVRP